MSTCTCRWVSAWTQIGPPFWDLSYRKRDPKCPQHGDAILFSPLANARAAMALYMTRQANESWSMADLSNGLTVHVAEQMRNRLRGHGINEETAESFIDELAEVAVEGVVKLWKEGGEGSLLGYPEMPQTKDEWEAHCAFYRLTVDQRNRAWETIRTLKSQLRADAQGLLQLAED